MQIKRYYNGYTLIYAIVVIIIITSVSLLFLSAFSLNDMLFITVKQQTLAYYYGYDGLNLLHNSKDYDKTLSLHFEDGYDEVLYKNQWGAYDVEHVAVKRSNGDTLFSKISLTGYKKDTTSSVGLFLRKTNTQLSLGDSVTIEGICYIPLGFFKQNNSLRNFSIQSTIHSSPDALVGLPAAEKLLTWISLIRKLSLKSALLSDSEYHSFAFLPSMITGDTIVVTGSVKGNVLIIAKYINVLGEAVIDDAILVANDIFIQKGFKGNLQIFASDTIIMADNVHLNYPTTIALLPAIREDRIRVDCTPVLSIGASFRLSGEIYAYSKSQDVNRKMKVRIERNSVVYGGIFTTSSLYWNGVCRGSVFCDKIIYNDDHSDYENFIQKAAIIPDSLPGFFTYSMLFPGLANKSIIKWL